MLRHDACNPESALRIRQNSVGAFGGQRLVTLRFKQEVVEAMLLAVPLEAGLQFLESLPVIGGRRVVFGGIWAEGTGVRSVAVACSA